MKVTMKLGLLSALLLFLLAQTPIPMAFWGGLLTVFDAAYTSNGITPLSTAGWPVTGVAAPSVIWDAADPTGANVGTGSETTTHAFTETGSTEAINTPFCPDGTWSDITSGCLKARRFDGTNDYYTSNANGVMDANSGDFVVCVIARTNNTVAETNNIVDMRDNDGTGDGWTLQHAPSLRIASYVANEAAGTKTVVFDDWTVSVKGWFISCLQSDYDGNQAVYINGALDTSTYGAGPGGTITVADDPVVIGSRFDFANKFEGDIAAVFWWGSLITAANILDLQEYFIGILETEEPSPVAFANTGPTCGWYGSPAMLECFSDNFAMLGSSMSPGSVGAGSPATGFYVSPSMTNSLVYSRDLSTGWTATDRGGAGVVACSQSPSPFADARTTCTITDDSAAANYPELIDQHITHGMGGSGNVTLCLYAYGDASEYLDVRMLERTGGSCGNAAYEFAAVQPPATWTQYAYTFALTDANCSQVKIQLCPVADCAASNTDIGGPIYIVAQLYLNASECPPTYIETGAAAVAAGDDELVFDVSGSSWITGGALVGTKQIEFNFTPGIANNAATAYLLTLSDNSASDYLSLAWDTNEKLLLLDETGTFITSSTAMNTPGTTYAIKASVNFDTDAYQIWIDGVSEGTDATARTSPAGITDMNIGSLYDETAQPTAGWIDSVTVKQ